MKFSDLVKIYRKSEFLTELNSATYAIKDQLDLNDIEFVIRNQEDIYIDVIQSSYDIGDVVDLNLDQPIKFGRIYQNYSSYIKSDMQFLFTTFGKTPFYIINEDIFSEDSKLPSKVKSYQLVKVFASSLLKMCSYNDETHSNLIFFGKKTFALSTEIESSIAEQFSYEIEMMDEIERKVIQDFCLWLDDEATDSHIDEKKAILSFVLNEIFVDNQKASILDVLRNIKQAYEAIQGQYSLYLENFCYEKFVKKLESNSEKFVTRINDTISKLLPQFLGIPILTAVPTAIKAGNHFLIYIAIIVYCIICYFALQNQKAVLDYLNEDIESFEEKGKIPLSLKTQWKDDKNRIFKLMDNQQLLYKILYCVVVFCFCYAVGSLSAFGYNLLVS